MRRHLKRTPSQFLQRALALLVVVSCCLCAESGWTQTDTSEPEVSGIRFGINPPRTRIVIDIEEFVRFQPQRLADPDRLVVDLPEVRWRPRPMPQSRPTGLVRSFRFGRREPGVDRLEVAIKEPFEITRTLVLEPNRDSPHYRLVIDIEPSNQRPPPSPPPVETTSVARESVEDPELPSPLLRPERAPPPPNKVIVLDAGHGGRDPGAISISGVHESEITLKMARELASLLTETGRYDVILTRSADIGLTLPRRIEIAREASADLFISLHADSIGKPEQRGASVYTLSETASDEEAAKMAQKENRVDVRFNGSDLSQHDGVVASVLIDLVQRDTQNNSIRVAELLVEELGDVTKLLRRTRRYAGFAVLRSVDVPSVLVELGYLSNLEDAALLGDKNHREKLGRAIVKAVNRYFHLPN